MRPLNYKYVYHSHTERCGHAYGSDEQFVQYAIAQGVKILCFTDHTPIPNVSQPGTRMDTSELDNYVSSIEILREKYKDKIEIHIGLEVENFPTNNAYLWEFLHNKGIEHVIIGQHVVMIDNNVVWLSNKDLNKQLIIDTYVDSITNAIETGLSKYIAHPDMLIACLGEYSPAVEKAMRTIVECAIKYDAYVEFNIHGIYNHNLKEFGYPNIYFWKMVKKDYPEAKIVIGLDIHRLEEYTDNIYLDKGLEVIKEIGLSPIPYLDYKDLLPRK